MTEDEKRILILEETLRVIRGAYSSDNMFHKVIEGGLKGERPIPIPGWFEPREYVASNLRSLLLALPEANTGDWYGQLLGWCGETLAKNPGYGPNATGAEIRARVIAKEVRIERVIQKLKKRNLRLVSEAFAKAQAEFKTIMTGLRREHEAVRRKS